MDRRHHGQLPTTLDEELAQETPQFHEKLGFVFEIVQVVPGSVMPGPPPVPLVLTEMDNIDLATKPPNRPPPGAVETGSPIMPPFMGQLPPIKIEGHDITNLSLDMETHGFTGRLRFRVSDTKLLGDVKDKDQVARAFGSQNLLMLKLCLRPEYSDVRGLAPLTPEMVPQIVSTVPIPVVPPVNPSIQLELAQLRMLPQEIRLEIQQKRLLLQQQLLEIQQTLITLQQQATALSQQLSIVTRTPQTPESLALATEQIDDELAANAAQTQALLKNQQIILSELAKPIPVPDVSAQLDALSSVAPPGVLPPKEQPVIVATPDVVGIPQLLEPGISPNGPLVPIEMLLTAVVTSHTVSQHTSFEANDLIVSFREYAIEFCDPAQALWKEHFPIALYTQSSVADVIKKNSNLLINVKVKSSVLSIPQDQIFLSLNKDTRVAERASFYDWLIWRLDEAGHALTYDYSQNIYLVQERAKRPKPFQVFARDIGKIITTHTLGRFYQETLMNDSARIATSQPILNLLALSPLRQDHWFHTPVPTEYATEYAKRLASFAQPQPGFLLYFKRFPSRPFPPGVGIDFHLDPIDFPSHRFVIPKAAKKTNRVTRMVFSAQTDERDVLPRFRGKSTGMFRCSLAVWLQTGRDTEAKLPPYTRPQYPMEVEGIIYTIVGLPGTQMWENETDLLTGQQYYLVQLPVFGCQRVKTPFIPNYQPGQYFFPAYRKERVLVGLYYDRAEILRYLDWRPMAPLPAEVQGNQLMIGQDFTNGAAHTLIYEKDIPEYIIKRQRYSSVQFIRMYQSGIEQKSIPMVSPKVDAAIQRATLAASQALEINCMGGVAAGAAGGGAAGGASGGGAPKASAAESGAAKVQGRVRSRAAAKTVKTTQPVTASAAPPAAKKAAQPVASRVRKAMAAQPADVFSSSGRFDTDAKESTSPRRPLRVPSPKDSPDRARVRMRAGVEDVYEQEEAAVLVADAPRATAAPDPRRQSPGDSSKSGGSARRDHRESGDRKESTPATGQGRADSPRPGSPTTADKEIPAHCRFGLDSGTGAALEVSCPEHDAKHAILVGQKGITIETENGPAKASIEQHGDTIAIKCRELTIDVDQIRVRSQTSSSFQSLGQMTLSSLSNLSLQTPSGMNLTAMNGVTVNALTVLINALKTIRLLGLTGGVGTFAAGPGVHSYGSEVSSTGLTNTVAGVSTYVHGSQVEVGPRPNPPAQSEESGTAAEVSADANPKAESGDASRLAAQLLAQFLAPQSQAQSQAQSQSQLSGRAASAQPAGSASPSALPPPASGGSVPSSGSAASREPPHPLHPSRPAAPLHPAPIAAHRAEPAAPLKHTIASQAPHVEAAVAKFGPSLFGATPHGGPVVSQQPGHTGHVAQTVAQIESMVARAAGAVSVRESAEDQSASQVATAVESFRGLLSRGAPGQSPYVVMRRLVSLFAHMTWEGQTPIEMLHTFQRAASTAPRPLSELQELLCLFQTKESPAAGGSSDAAGEDRERPPAPLLNALQEYLADLGSTLPPPVPSTPPPPDRDVSLTAPPPTQSLDSMPPASAAADSVPATQVPGLVRAQIEALLEAVSKDNLGDTLTEKPDLIPQILSAALAARSGGLSGELSAPLLVIAESLLESRPEVAVLLALLGVAARAGLLPPRLATHAVAGYQLASLSSIEVAELRAQLLQKESASAERRGSVAIPERSADRVQPLLDLAAAAADSGLLPRSSATTIAENPAAAIARLPEMIAVTEILTMTERILAGHPAPLERPGPLLQIRRPQVRSGLGDPTGPRAQASSPSAVGDSASAAAAASAADSVPSSAAASGPGSTADSVLGSTADSAIDSASVSASVSTSVSGSKLGSVSSVLAQLEQSLRALFAASTDPSDPAASTQDVVAAAGLSDEPSSLLSSVVAAQLSLAQGHKVLSLSAEELDSAAALLLRSPQTDALMSGLDRARQAAAQLPIPQRLTGPLERVFAVLDRARSRMSSRDLGNAAAASQTASLRASLVPSIATIGASETDWIYRLIAFVEAVQQKIDSYSASIREESGRI